MAVKEAWTGHVDENFQIGDIYPHPRESKSRPDVGIVRVKTTGFDQNGTAVIEFNRTLLGHKRGCIPQTARSLGPDAKTSPAS
jgi:hypothetical protein